MIQSKCILTERLILRDFVDGDAEDILALMSDDYICRMIGIHPFKNIRDAEQFIDNQRYGAYVITERGSDKVIGIIQVVIMPWFRNATLGYWLAEEYRGQGYMTEVVEAVKEMLFSTMWCEELLIYIYVGNEASKRVALKCGFYPKYDEYKECVYSLYGRMESEECYSITRGDYEWEQSGVSFYTTDPRAKAA